MLETTHSEDSGNFVLTSVVAAFRKISVDKFHYYLVVKGHRHGRNLSVWKYWKVGYKSERKPRSFTRSLRKGERKRLIWTSCTNVVLRVSTYRAMERSISGILCAIMYYKTFSTEDKVLVADQLDSVLEVMFIIASYDQC